MFAIKNFGILWERKYIHYGWNGSPGHLNGYKRGMPRADFREQSGVYVLYDKDMIPVYVGQAGRGNANLFSRLKQHEHDHLWNRWVYFSWFGLHKVNRTGSLSMPNNSSKNISGSVVNALNDIEGVLILALEPKLNKQGAKFKDVQQFYQSIDEKVTESTVSDAINLINKLNNKIEKLEKKINKWS